MSAFVDNAHIITVSFGPADGLFVVFKSFSVFGGGEHVRAEGRSIWVRSAEV